MTTLFVHGFQYDPKSTGRDNPHVHTFPRWRKMLPEGEVLYHSWFSVPLTKANVWRAWRYGHRWNRYRWAWDLAEAEGAVLARRRMSMSSPPNIVCHSLGSRVVLKALEMGMPASRVLLLNGAEYQVQGLRIARMRKDVEFFATVVPEDDVLNKLGRFAPGWGGNFVGNTPHLGRGSNWTDLPLDDEIFQIKLLGSHGWRVAGDNPDQAGDHWYSFEHEDNWPLYRAILDRSWPT